MRCSVVCIRVGVRAYALAAIMLLTGCAAAPNALNYATADALDYGRLSASVARKSPELARAVERISKSNEHRRMQTVLADLPADMTRCLVVEMADLDAGEPVPAVVAMFHTEGSVGFMSNFSFDAEGSTSDAGGGWRAAVWDAPDDADSLLPDDPESVLPVTEPTTRRGLHTIVIVTLATPHHVISIADWAEDQPDKRKGARMIRYVPKRMRAKLGAGQQL